MTMINTAGKTLHSPECKRVFARLDTTCPRCKELAMGAVRRQGWGALAKRNEEARLRAIRGHNFELCRQKNIVCTCFDW